MESVCPKGHIWYFAWAEFKKGYRCKYCKIRPSKGESELGKVLKEIFGADRVRRQSNLGFLERQTVDYFICDLNLAFEYDGEQHFFPVRYGNRSIKQAKEDFEKQQIRDQRKDLLCQRNGIRLIRFSYKEKITRNLIENKVENLIEDKVGG
jgi:very-short-patch-repair endonuclease